MGRSILLKALPCAIALALATTATPTFSSPNAEAKVISELLTEAARDAENPLKDIKITPSEKYLKLAESMVRPTNEKAVSEMSAVAALMGQDTSAYSGEDPYQMKGDWVDILVSRSLGQAALKQMIADAEGSDIPVRFVFRGVPEGKKINDAFSDYGVLIKGLEDPPEAVLDPTPFQDHNVESVPYMMFMRDGKYVASVEGLTNYEWLEKAVNRGETGHLGVRGPVEEISEPDIITVMMKKAESLDLEEQKKETVRTYWDRAEFTYMQPAREDKQKEIDPSFVLDDHITDPNGKVLVEQGTVVNPLLMQPFNMRLVVFDPTRKEEVEWVKSLAPVKGLDDVLIASQFNREKGWDGLNELNAALESSVFLLQSDMKSRFHLARTPSLVTAENFKFIVNEYEVKESVSSDQSTK